MILSLTGLHGLRRKIVKELPEGRSSAQFGQAIEAELYSYDYKIGEWWRDIMYTQNFHCTITLFKQIEILQKAGLINEKT